MQVFYFYKEMRLSWICLSLDGSVKGCVFVKADANSLLSQETV